VKFLLPIFALFVYVYVVPVQLASLIGPVGFFAAVMAPFPPLLMVYRRRHDNYVEDRWETSRTVESYMTLPGVIRKNVEIEDS
jgi:hypothetical protein